MKRILITVFLTIYNICIFSQNTDIPILERKISISHKSEDLSAILEDISRQGGFVFSYSPDIIESFGKQSIIVEDKSVRHTLNSLFGRQISYSTRRNYVILKRDDNFQDFENKKEIIVEGYLFDSETGEVLKNASIYSTEQMTSSVTDNFGYFKMQMPIRRDINIRVSKSGYENQRLNILDSSYKYLQIELSELNLEESDLENDDMRVVPFREKLKLQFTESLISREMLVNINNIKEPIFSQYQFSLLPGISTNRLLSGNTVNRFSLNLILGYVEGVELMEIGGVGNMVKNDAGMLQAAGVFNIIGGTSSGVQAAGIFNHANILSGVQAAGVYNIIEDSSLGAQTSGVFNRTGSLIGVQAAGVFNICNENVLGTQAAGIFNLAGTVNGAQASGVFNITKNHSEAIQASGVFNNAEKMSGVQAAGVFNNADTVKGTQIAGVFNNANSIRGLQIAGVFNEAHTMKGAQISGVFNKATHIKGVQISFMNFADTCDGVPIGFLSIIKNGYNKLDVYTDEIFYTNLAYRGGVNRFYNIFSTGTLPMHLREPLWTYGYGLGSCLWYSERFSFALEAQAQNIINADNFSFDKMLIKPGIDIYIGLYQKIGINIGIFYNMFLFDKQSDNQDNIVSNIMPYYISETNLYEDRYLKSWIGGKVGLRFF